MNDIRTGIGYDVHRLAEGEELWLGGILIEHERGAVGHSDADVLLHAITDALLGAAALGDIGAHFPDTDPQYKGADSKVLLEKSYALVGEKGYVIGNLDATLCLQRPKVRPHIDRMRETIAGLLNLHIDRISIKATTTETLGFVGREEGVSAYATVLIHR